MTPQEYCQDKAAKSGSSFYYAFLFLPPARRQAITALYAFCREVDDVVDECTDTSLARIKLAWWRTEVASAYAGQPSHPAMRALMPLAASVAITSSHFARSVLTRKSSGAVVWFKPRVQTAIWVIIGMTCQLCLTHWWTCELTCIWRHNLFFADRHERASADQHRAIMTLWQLLLHLFSFVLPAVVMAAFMPLAGRWVMGPSVQPLRRRMAVHALSTAPFWLALAGVVTAWYMYLFNPKVPAFFARALRPLIVVMENKYYMDWINENILAKGARGLGLGLWKVGDRAIIDGFFVNGSWKVVGLVSGVVRWFQSGFLYHYALVMILGVFVLMTYFVWLA